MSYYGISSKLLFTKKYCTDIRANFVTDISLFEFCIALHNISFLSKLSIKLHDIPFLLELSINLPDIPFFSELSVNLHDIQFLESAFSNSSSTSVHGRDVQLPCLISTEEATKPGLLPHGET